MSRRPKGVAGQVFGGLRALSPTSERDKHRSVIWKCECLVCGGEKLMSMMRLNRDMPNRSCGCTEHAREARTEPGESGRQRFYSQYRLGALKRDLEWNLTKEEFAEITGKPCYYCKIESSVTTVGSLGLRLDYGKYTSNGIDRKDNTKGYFKENVLPCCTRCNLAKGTQTYDEFIEWLKRLVNNFTF
jgi:hypothetical protein